MHRITPPLHAPALLSPDLALLQIRELPEMVHGIQLADLHEPRTDTFHYFSSGAETTTPVCFPFKEIAGV